MYTVYDWQWRLVLLVKYRHVHGIRLAMASGPAGIIQACTRYITGGGVWYNTQRGEPSACYVNDVPLVSPAFSALIHYIHPECKGLYRQDTL
ncbi:hypothetical protein GDO78_018207 [Eleutherodactylus coqui]|uniref:Uncharacterized protein n=1 Tax=Eleutherodactylus coqui TaxID=57060 RepID=A0A8J6EBS9_ELECQ|nr:hypothetical protein GDO78_018207 [Eleutherodactylus coqui]